MKSSDKAFIRVYAQRDSQSEDHSAAAQPPGAADDMPTTLPPIVATDISEDAVFKALTDKTLERSVGGRAEARRAPAAPEFVVSAEMSTMTPIAAPRPVSMSNDEIEDVGPIDNDAISAIDSLISGTPSGVWSASLSNAPTVDGEREVEALLKQWSRENVNQITWADDRRRPAPTKRPTIQVESIDKAEEAAEAPADDIAAEESSSVEDAAPDEPTFTEPVDEMTEPDRDDPIAEESSDEQVDDDGLIAGRRVEAFRWPQRSLRLEYAARDQIDALADNAAAAFASGRKILGVTSRETGEGCTTVVLCTAKRLAQRGYRVVVVDASTNAPEVAVNLGITPLSGWNSATTSHDRLGEVLVESTADRLTILPMATNDDVPIPYRVELSAQLKLLADAFDVVLVDLGPFATAESNSIDLDIHEAIDGVMIVQNVRTTSPEQLAELRDRIREAGLRETGVAENFVHATACSVPHQSEKRSANEA